MKTSIQIFFFGFLSTMIISCKQQDKSQCNSLANSDSLKTKQELLEEERIENRKTIEEQNKRDSLRLAKIMIEALKIADQNIRKDTFSIEYNVIYDSVSTRVEINSDYYFSRYFTHLIIRRDESNAMYIDIFYKKNNRFKNVLSHEQWSLTYVNDTIWDINGDGFKDFVVNWYGATGCCLKGFSDVYLLRQNKKDFTDQFEFINPTFAPDEKIVRGVCYGHPGETPLYKYKWNQYKVDTLEYVYFEKDENGNRTGKILISNNEPSGIFIILNRLNKVPVEYTKIQGYDWFTGFQTE